MTLNPSVDHLGPMTSTVKDCALLLEVMAGYDDGLDPRQCPHIQVPEYTKLLTRDIKGMRLGLLKEGFTIQIFQDSCCSIENKFFYHVSILCVAQFQKGYYSSSLHEDVTKGITTRLNDLNGIQKGVFLTCEFMKRNYGKKFYALAQNQVVQLTKAVESFDVLVLPNSLFTAPKLPAAGASTSGRSWSSIQVKEIMALALSITKNNSTFNLSGHPALSINAGFSNGLPVGLQIVGRHFDEVTVLQVANNYERIRDSRGLKTAC